MSASGEIAAMYVNLLATAVALAFCVAANAASFEFSQAGTLKVDNGAERSATLHLACSPDNEGGALSIELMVPEANTRKDFDYDDFEGPDAVAGGKPLSHIAWISATSTTEISYAAAGWYIPDPAGAFMFGVSQPSHHRKPPANLIAAIGPDPGRLVWTQTGFDKARHELVATFELDAAVAEKLHAAVVRCLPINSPKNPGS
jgi:hypothetical protein